MTTPYPSSGARQTAEELRMRTRSDKVRGSVRLTAELTELYIHARIEKYTPEHFDRANVEPLMRLRTPHHAYFLPGRQRS